MRLKLGMFSKEGRVVRSELVPGGMLVTIELADGRTTTIELTGADVEALVAPLRSAAK